MTDQTLHAVAKWAVPLVLCVALWFTLDFINSHVGFVVAGAIALSIFVLLVVRLIRKSAA